MTGPDNARHCARPYGRSFGLAVAGLAAALALALLVGAALAGPPSAPAASGTAVATVDETAARAASAATAPSARPLDVSSRVFGVRSTVWPIGGASKASFEVEVGFPAVGAHAARRWAPMLAWRERALTATSLRREPIAGVRCMGLTPEQVAARADRFAPDVLSVAIENGISASLLNAVVTVESCFDPEARSRVGAIGLMQLMPDTARWLGEATPEDPARNLATGARYLASLIDEFEQLDLALAAYNAGPGTVRRAGGVPNYPETEHYVKRVLAHYRRYVAAARHGPVDSSA